MSDTDLQRAARRRAHNAHALERCNAMGRTAGSILWQPLQKRDGKWFMPDGAALPEPPIEWRSEKLETILDEMDALQAVVPVADPGKTYVESLDIADWKASVDAQFDEGAARPHVYKAGEEITEGQPVTIGADGMLHVIGPITRVPMPPVFTFPPGYLPPTDPPPSVGDVLSKFAEHVESGGSVNATISLEELEKALLEPDDDGVHVHINPDGTVSRSVFTQYRRKQIAELRPYIDGELLADVSMSVPDRLAGSPKLGDMIARNPKNHADQWLVAEQYFKDNFEPIE